MFTDSKALEWGPGRRLFRLVSATEEGDFYGAFLDAAGEPIPGTAFVGMFGSDLSPANVAVVVLDTVVVFRGMQFIAVDGQGEPGLGRSAYQIRWVNDDAPLVVPEPSTALLLGMALLGLSLRRGRATVPLPL